MKVHDKVQGKAHGENSAAASVSAPTISVVNQFIEDYQLGGLNVGKLSHTQKFLFAARDRSLNCYFIPDSSMGSVARAYRDPDSETGWSIQTVAVPMASRLGPPFAHPATNQLVLKSDAFIYTYTLGPDGSIGELASQKASDGGWLPLVPACGSFSLKSLHDIWVPEVLPKSGSNAPAALRLRNLKDLSVCPVSGSPALPTSIFFRDARFLPVPGSPDGFYNYVTVDSSNGNLVHQCLQLDPNSNSFHIAATNIPGGPKGTVFTAGNSLVSGTPFWVFQPSPGQVTLIAFNLPQITTFSGRYLMGNIVWSAPTVVTVDPVPASTVSPARCYGSWDETNGVLDVFIEANSTWSIVWSSAAGWGPLVPLPDLHIDGMFATGSPTLLTHGADSAFVVSRDSYGNFHTEAIQLESDAASATPVAAWRTGVTVTRDGKPAIDEYVSLWATEPVLAVVGGKHVPLGPNSYFKAQTDQTGTFWMTIFPYALTPALPMLAADGMTDALQLQLDAGVHKYMSTVTDAALAAATDPFNSNKMIPNPANAPAAGDAIRKVMTAVPAAAASTAAAAAGVRVTGNCPARWIARPASAAMISVPPRPANKLDDTAFALETVGGELVFKTLTADEAGTRIALLHAQHPPIARANLRATAAGGPIHPMGLLDDFVDWAGGVLHDAWDLGVKVLDFVVGGGKMVLTLVVDGIKYVYSAALDTVERVMDAVAFILDKAGAVLGSVLNWLLEQLGFLFDWKAIKAQRDSLKSAFRARSTAFVRALQDPASGFQDLSGEIDAIKANAATMLNKLRSRPELTSSFGKTQSSLPSVASFFMNASGSIMPQATWLLEKVQSVFPQSRFNPGAPAIPGLQDAVTTLGTQLAGIQTTILNVMSDFVTATASWLVSEDGFLSGNLDILIDFLIRCSNSVLDAAKSILTAAGAVFHAIWANPGAVVDWLDQKLPFGFFGGFYRGLTGNDLSVLDVTCLLTAIPMVVLGGTRKSAAATAGDDLHNASMGFRAASCLTIFASTAVTATQPKQGSGWQKIGYALSGLDVAASLGSAVCMTWETNDQQMAIARTTILGAVVTAMGIFLATSDDRDGWITAGEAVSAIVNGLKLAFDVWKTDNSTLIAYDSIETLQRVFAVLVRLSRPMDPLKAALCGNVQALLSSIKLGLSETASAHAAVAPA